MANTATFTSRYDSRVTLVQDVVKSDTTLDEKTARALAMHVLHALDTIPETVR